MIFRCSLKKWKTRKSSGRINLIIKPEDIPDKLYNFENKPVNINLGQMSRASGELKNIEQLVNSEIKLTIITDEDSKKELVTQGPKLKALKDFQAELLINEDEQVKRLNAITGDQRAKAYATMKDIGDSLGYELNEIKKVLKREFANVSKYGDISLSDCSRSAAADFIDFSIRLGYEMGVQWEEHPRERMDSLEKWLRLCLDQKICAVSGKPGKEYLIDNSGDIIHTHHADAIGMGQNRQKLDDSELRKISLSAEYHNEAHNMGWESFKKKYHVEAIVYP